MAGEFDLEGARKSGYGDAEIADFLAGQHGFDLKGARAAGYNDTEIVGSLSTRQRGGTAAEIAAATPAARMQPRRQMQPTPAPVAAEPVSAPAPVLEEPTPEEITAASQPFRTPRTIAPARVPAAPAPATPVLTDKLPPAMPPAAQPAELPPNDAELAAASQPARPAMTRAGQPRIQGSQPAMTEASLPANYREQVSAYEFDPYETPKPAFYDYVKENKLDVDQTPEVVRGFKAGAIGGTTETTGRSVEMAGSIARHPGMEKFGEDLAHKGDKYQESLKQKARPIQDMIESGDYTGVGDYLLYQFGSALGSTMPSIVAGGAVASMTANPLVGLVAGAAAPSFIQNSGDVFGSAIKDKDIQNLIAMGALDKRSVAIQSAWFSVPVAALDLASLGSIGSSILGPGKAELKKVLNTALKDWAIAVAKGGAGGAATEGLTEGAQEAISVWARKWLGAHPDAITSFWAVLENMLGGAMVGGAMGGGGKAAKTPISETGRFGQALADTIEATHFSREATDAAARARLHQGIVAPGVAGAPPPSSAADLARYMASDKPLPTMRQDDAAAAHAQAADAAGRAEASIAAVQQEQQETVAAAAGIPGVGEQALVTIGNKSYSGTVSDLYPSISPITGEDSTGGKLRLASGQEIDFDTGDAQVTRAPAGAGTPENPIVATEPEHVEHAATRVDTEPTDAQKEAGNYRKGHIELHGLEISIENPKGSERTGYSRDNWTEASKQWSVTMPAHYGYIKRSKGADAEQVDVYIGDVPTSQQVWIVDQIDPKTGKFDEHKVMLGFGTAVEARRNYEAGFSDGSGRYRMGAMTHMDIDQFKEWLKTESQKEPLAYVEQADEQHEPFVYLDENRVPGGDGAKYEWKAADNGKPVKLPGFDDFTFFIQRNEARDGWKIIEATSGRTVGGNSYRKTSRADAIANTIEHINRSGGAARLLELVLQNHREHGIAPGWKQQAAKLKQLAPLSTHEGWTSNVTKAPSGALTGATLHTKGDWSIREKPDAPSGKTYFEVWKRQGGNKPHQEIGSAWSWAEAEALTKGAPNAIQTVPEGKQQAQPGTGGPASTEGKGAAEVRPQGEAGGTGASGPAQPVRPQGSEPAGSGAGGPAVPGTSGTDGTAGTGDQQLLRGPAAAAGKEGEAAADARIGVLYSWKYKGKTRRGRVIKILQGGARVQLGEGPIGKPGVHAWFDVPWMKLKRIAFDLAGDMMPPEVTKEDLKKPEGETPKVEIVAPAPRVTPGTAKNNAALLNALRKEEKLLRQGMPVAEDMAMNDKGASLARLEAKIEENLRKQRELMAPPETKEPTGARPATGGEVIGKNAKGQDVYQDARGVRSIVEDGVRHTEAVQMVPTREGVKIAVQHKGDYLTAEESAPTVADIHKLATEKGIPWDGNEAFMDWTEGLTGKRHLDDLTPILRQRVLDALNGTPTETITVKAPTAPKGYGDTNKVFTKDAADKARELLRKKLGQITTGLDPEVMQAGIQLAGYHVEAGARTFAQFTKAMVADLGEAVRPYLQSWYLAVRSWPGFDKTGMQTEAQIEKEIADGQAATGGAGPATLEGVPTDKVPGAEGERPTGGGAVVSGGTDAQGDAGRPGSGVSGPRGVGDGDAKLAPAAGGAGTEQGGTGQPGVGLPGGKEQSAGSTRGSNPGEIIQQPENFVITDELEFVKSGVVEKYNGNIAAIKVLKKIEAENRNATPDEQKVLARYVGWGGIKQAFPRPGAAPVALWEGRVAKLLELLTPEEHEAAASSIQDSHYTSKPVVTGMWAIARHLGFTGGKVLEHSMGVGNFFGLIPPELRAAAALTGVERDIITARIAKQLYPKANVIGATAFEDAIFQDWIFNLIIGNPPFGNKRVFDKNSKHLNEFSIHNFFFAKSIDKLAAGGVSMQVVSRYLMDAETSTAREYLAHRTRLIGAIRLPWTAFYSNAGTEVVTDIVILQKMEESDWGKSDQSWTKTTTIPDPLGGEPMVVNQYYADHPDMILGQMDRSGEMQHEQDITVQPIKDEPLELGIARAAMNLPAEVFWRGKSQEQTKNDDVASVIAPTDVIEGYNVGSYFEHGGKLFQRTLTADGSIEAREIHADVLWGEKQPWGKTRIDRLRGMIEIRDTARALLKAEKTGAGDIQINKLRATLNRVYDAFVKEHGYLNEEENERTFRADQSDAPLLLSLENKFQRGVKFGRAKALRIQVQPASAEKATIFTEVTAAPYIAQTHADNVADGAMISIMEKGVISVPYIASLTGKGEQEVIEDLTKGEKPLAYLDPASQTYESAPFYLSGNVKRKYKEAREAGLFEQADALKVAFPPDKKAGDISVMMGAPWIENGEYENFVRSLLGDTAVPTIRFMQATGGYAVHITGGDSVMLNKKWGLSQVEWQDDDGKNHNNYGRDAIDLITRVLNNRDVARTYTDSDGNKYQIKEVNQALQDKADEIRAEFAEWVFRDSDRREKLVSFYNEHMNTTVDTVWDGSYLELPGKVPDAIIDMRRHQLNAIARWIRTGKILLDHVVGSGKTYTIIAALMEMRRIGLVKKPMIVVPNHLVLYWAQAFFRLYPGAKILAMRKDDFAKQNRRVMLARVATSDWDAVIFAHSSFGFIENDRELTAQFMREQIAEIQAAIDAARATEGKKSRTAAGYQKTKDKLMARLKSLLDKPKDNVLTFQELGVDQVTVDESQEFKNLFFTTQRRGTGGLGNPNGSKRAMDLFIKTQWLQRVNNGRGVAFASGTPVSNSLTELFTLQRYMGLDELKSRGITSLDAWLASFGVTAVEHESNLTGTKYKRKERLRRITNAPAVMQLYKAYTDSITNDDVKRNYREDNNGAEFPIPKVKGGKARINVAVPESDTQRAMAARFTFRLEHLPADQSIDNALKVLGEARKAALDVRILDPSLPDNPTGKTHVAADAVARIYDANTYRSGTQLVFCDLSTPKKHATKDALKYLKEARRLLKDDNAAPLGSHSSQWDDLRAMLENRRDALEEGDNVSDEEGVDAIEKFLEQKDEIESAVNTADSGFSVYDDFRQKLIDRGIKPEEIAFIHDFNSDKQKQDLFDMVNAGRIRVLMGSTMKMGAGTNVQERAVGEIHLDVPWRPSDVEQREGRIIRQGNKFRQDKSIGFDDQNFEVEIIAYATKPSSDVFLWQIQEQKLIAIQSLRNYKGENEIEDVGADSLSAAEMKALASGNPLILEDVQLTESIRKLEQQRRRHNSTQQDLEAEAKRYERYIDQLPAIIARQQGTVAKIEDYRADPFAGVDRPKAEIDGQMMNATEARDHIVEVQKEAESIADEANKGARAPLLALQEQAAKIPYGKEYDALMAQYKELESEFKKTAVKPSLKITFAGKEYISADGAINAIAREIGDVRAFRMVMDGESIVRRKDAEKKVGIVLETLQPEKPVTIGTIAGMDVQLTGVEKAYGTGVEIRFGGEKEFVEGGSRMIQDGQTFRHERTPVTGEHVLQKLLTMIGGGIKSDMQSNQGYLEKAQKGLEPLKAQLGKEWGKDAELDEKRARIVEVRRQLSQDVPVQAAAQPEVASIDAYGISPGDLEKKLREQGFGKDDFENIHDEWENHGEWVRHKRPTDIAPRAVKLYQAIDKIIRDAGAGKLSLGGAPPSTKTQQQIRTAVREIVQSMAPRADLNMVDQYFASGPGIKRSGGIGTARQQVAGAYARGVITIALGYSNPEITARHEVIHALRDMGMFSDPEWAVLTHQAEAHWKKQFKVPDTEEAIAYAFQAHRAGQRERGMVGRAFDRIARFFERLGNALRGLGFQSVEDIFAAVESGEIGRRPGTTAAGEERFSPAQTLTEAFKRWFGASKVVDAEGRPLVVYHASPEKFNIFDTSKEGAHFGTLEQAENLKKPGKRKPMAVFLSIKNPLRMMDIGQFDDFNGMHAQLARDDILTMSEADAVWAEWQKSDTAGWNALKKTVESKGYDGIVYENEQEGRGDSYIAFHPEQIKSATGNTGAFDPTNPDIRYSLGEPVVSRVLGVDDTVLDRERLTPEATAAGAAHAKEVFNRVGLAVVPRGKNLWDLADKMAEPGTMDDAGYRLLEALRREIRLRDTGPESQLLASLTTSIVEYIGADENVGISKPLRMKLVGYAQGERSHYGYLLGSLAQVNREDFQRMARNVDTILEREYHDRFDGQGVQAILDDVLTNFREQFTDAEIGLIAQHSKELIALIERIQTRSERDRGGRLYRKVQQLFKDKQPKTMEALVDDAQINEAAQKIIADLRQFNIHPIPRPGKKALTPMEQLLLMVDPETSEMIDQKIAEAIGEAERNAGIRASLEEATPDERDLMREAFRKGLNPTPAMVEQGMQEDEFQHWRVLRDNLMGYSPITLKLAQEVIRGDFKGTKFGAPAPKPVDVRIDLNALAKSPEAEVRRVLDEYMAVLGGEMLLAGAAPGTAVRVAQMVQAQVTAQLEEARTRVRDKAFQPAAPGSTPMPGQATQQAYQALKEHFNAGLLSDQRFDALVSRLAGKSMVRNLIPSLESMVKKVFETPFYRQSELANRFSRQLSLTYGLSEPQRRKAEALFHAAFDERFKRAQAKALASVQKSLTPKQATTVRTVPKLWEQIEKSVNAGLFDNTAVMEGIARARGWSVPSAVDLAEIKTLARREQELAELSDDQRDTAERLGNVAEAEDVKLRATQAERSHLKREMQALWLRWTAPLTMRTKEGRKNVAAAVNEITSANLLLRPGFFVRQIIDVMTQNAIYTPTRATAEAVMRYRNDKARGRETRLLADVGSAMKDAYRQRTKHLRHALAKVKQGLAGRSESKNVEQILDHISIFDRAELKADELAAQGKTGQAFLMRAANQFAFAFRYAKALDELQGVLAEAQEMQAQVVSAFREQGLDNDESRARAADIMGDLNAEWLLAVARTTQIFQEAGIEATPTQIEQSAWDVVKGRQYVRITASKILADDFEAMNRLLRNTIGWNESEFSGLLMTPGGLGGAVAGFTKMVTGAAQEIGLPLPIARFGNAVGISINRTLTFTGLGYFESMFKGSPWYASERDKIQRKVEASVGLAFSSLFVALALAGLVIPRIKWPDTEPERELWRRIGRQPGTLEIMIGGGKYITVSLMVGPFAVIRPWMAFIGTILDSLRKQEERAVKHQQAAEKKGLEPAMEEPKHLNLMAAGAMAAYSAMLGGRTAVGIISNTTDYRAPQPERAAAAFVSPLVPGAPQWQELSRMAGVNLDAKRAGFMDFMFPTSGSDSEKRNFFYDPINEHTAERIIKVLTGGNYPYATTGLQKMDEKAYQVLGETGWRPPVVVNRAHEIGDQFRLFDQAEMQDYLKRRGTQLKREIFDQTFAGMSDREKLEALDEIYKGVNKDALQDTIDSILDRTGDTGRSPKIPPLKPRQPLEARP